MRSDKLVTAFPFCYGWIILAASAVGLVLSSPGQTYTVSTFLEHLIRDLGIGRSLVSTLYTVGTVDARIEPGGRLALPLPGASASEMIS